MIGFLSLDVCLHACLSCGLCLAVSLALSCSLALFLSCRETEHDMCRTIALRYLTSRNTRICHDAFGYAPRLSIPLRRWFTHCWKNMTVLHAFFCQIGKKIFRRYGKHAVALQGTYTP